MCIRWTPYWDCTICHLLSMITHVINITLNANLENYYVNGIFGEDSREQSEHSKYGANYANH